MTKAKKIDPPWVAEATNPTADKKSTRKSKEKSFKMKVFTTGQEVDLSFVSQRALTVAKNSIGVRCSRGTTAVVSTMGKEYTFVPNLGFIVIDVVD